MSFVFFSYSTLLLALDLHQRSRKSANKAPQPAYSSERTGIYLDKVKERARAREKTWFCQWLVILRFTMPYTESQRPRTIIVLWLCQVDDVIVSCCLWLMFCCECAEASFDACVWVCLLSLAWLCVLCLDVCEYLFVIITALCTQITHWNFFHERLPMPCKHTIHSSPFVYTYILSQR